MSDQNRAHRESRDGHLWHSCGLTMWHGIGVGGGEVRLDIGIAQAEARNLAPSIDGVANPYQVDLPPGDEVLNRLRLETQNQEQGINLALRELATTFLDPERQPLGLAQVDLIVVKKGLHEAVTATRGKPYPNSLPPRDG